MFGAGLVLGSLATGVLFAPPELANQPPPWEHVAQDQARAAAATHAAGAGPAQPVLAAAVQPALAASAAAPQPLALAAVSAASQPAGMAQAAAAPAAPGVAAPAAPTLAAPAAPVAASAEAAAAPQAAAAAKAQTVARSELAATPERKRKRPRVRHAGDDAAIDSGASSGAAADGSSGADRFEQPAPERRIARQQAAQDTARPGTDTQPMPPERAPQGDTLSGPPATTTVTRPATNHDDATGTATGDAAAGDASQ